MTRTSNRLYRWLAFLTAGALVLVGVGSGTVTVADTTPPAGTPPTVSADGLATWQINGVVWSQAVVNDIVYVTGSFTKARPPGVKAGGVGEVTALNIFAYDIRTGNRVTTFNHSLNGQSRAVAAAPDGSRVYVGGEFTTVDGIARGHVAASTPPPVHSCPRSIPTSTTGYVASPSPDPRQPAPSSWAAATAR